MAETARRFQSGLDQGRIVRHVSGQFLQKQSEQTQDMRT